jgi:hypothetical protein
LLSAESFVLGKLISALSCLFAGAGLHSLQSIAFLLGGLSLAELVISPALIVVAAGAYALYGLWCSATMRTTLAATVTTFADAVHHFGTPMLAGMAALGSTPARGYPPVSRVASLLQRLTAATNLPRHSSSRDDLSVEDALRLQPTLARQPGFFRPGLFILLHALARGPLRLTVRRVRRVSDV